ncbi:MAG: flagellar assembly peptidoglycan hydrolase FlgJ [Hydrogenophaga sp.]|jgi:peptidoglycan hydrolase FlgJ|uniref:Peptidoglycan hydrolase FlgJ n=1 Tax=Hydrogenophaga crocea TaxID=2716225 RepID=A0A6G8IMX6_9BURK|nr:MULTISPECIES: flagellar assembly peptidoglycan hydrolase FlgJ [Hydrogenophaga]MBL0943250.1 flagellar assembly peptidoglycan hydrolase FlgJ [Hydrogenophaga sp.]QIM54358.1 flagellar assembly peptidoglycan hydrolase FlgJ [Hydrogenophaga crocea]
MAIGTSITPAGLAADPTSLNALKAAGNDKAALKEAAKQFEALFMRELLKSMREATAKSGLMDSQGENMGTDLLDQQFSVQLSGLPGGLSEAIERQLGRQLTGQATDMQAPGGLRMPSTVDRVSATERQADFVEKHSAAAQAVARESGIPAAFMIGQAGHESGWGRGEIRHADGSPAFNLFGIKATGGWTGKVAEITTTEYIDGEPRKVTAKFRAYDSYEESFRDYARLIGNSPRYEGVMEQRHSVQGFASGLQRAGYATDPAYAAKLSRAINTTLSLQRAQG